MSDPATPSQAADAAAIVKSGWHFLRSDRRLGYEDNREALDGETLSYTGDEPECCKRGMHASEHVSQALAYAPGLVLCRVEVWGDIHAQTDKFAGRHRKVLWSISEAAVRELVVAYAQWCAERAREHDAAHDAAAAAAYAAAAAHDAHDAAAAAAYAAAAAHDAAAAAAYAYAAAYAAYAAAAAAAEREAQRQWWEDKLAPYVAANEGAKP